MPEIEIRLVGDADKQPLLDLEHDYQTNYVWQMERMFEEGQMNINFREVRLPRPVRVQYPHATQYLTEEWVKDAAVLAAYLNTVAVGYIRFKIIQTSKSIWVTDVVVREALRRKGIASALILASQEWAVQHQCRRTILEIQSKNQAAIRLALKLGFEFCGYNDHYYANQDIALFFGRYLR